MPEDLLLELETAVPDAPDLQSVEDKLRTMMHDVARAVGGIQGTALAFQNAWRQIIGEVARGQTTEIHAARPRLLRAFETRLRLLKQTHTLAAGLHGLSPVDVPDPDVLLPEIAEMERLKANVFDRWQTAEDLEDLAARDYPLTTADLEQIAPTRRPPASWYAEESKPFWRETVVPQLCRGAIVWVEILDPQGRNRKCRPAVIVTPDADIRADGEVWVVAVSKQLQ
jgi:hypothetical protein